MRSWDEDEEIPSTNEVTNARMERGIRLFVKIRGRFVFMGIFYSRKEIVPNSKTPRFRAKRLGVLVTH